MECTRFVGKDFFVPLVPVGSRAAADFFFNIFFNHENLEDCLTTVEEENHRRDMKKNQKVIVFQSSALLFAVEDIEVDLQSQSQQKG